MAPAPAAIECNGVWPIQARIPLIGRRPAIDLHLEEPSIAPVHAAIFTAGGVWHLRELSGQGDVLVNGAPHPSGGASWRRPGSHRQRADALADRRRAAAARCA
jgi:hypothetical protein